MHGWRYEEAPSFRLVAKGLSFRTEGDCGDYVYKAQATVEWYHCSISRGAVWNYAMSTQ